MLCGSLMLITIFQKKVPQSSGKRRSVMVQKAPKGREIMPRFRHPSDDWKTLSVDPAVNGYLFQIREG